MASYDPNVTPVLIPPPGVISNFIDPPSRGYIARYVVYALLPLMMAFIALRMWSRVIVRHTGFDDVLFLFAGASITTTCGLFLPYLDNPQGRHSWDVPVSMITDEFLKTNFFTTVIAALSSMLLKLSLLALYLRVFNPVINVNIAIYICAGAVTIFYVSTIVVELGAGIPRQGQSWDEAQVRYAQLGSRISVARGFFGIFADFVILFIPLIQIVPLHLQLKKKLMLLGIFLTGLLVCVCSTITCAYRYKLLNDLDYTWVSILPTSFNTIELTVGLICCSVPTLPPLMTHMSKTVTLTSLVNYLRSSHLTTRRNSIQIVLPESRKQLAAVNAPKGQVRGLRSFLQEAGSSTFSKIARDKKGGLETFDLETVDMDYHAQLQREAGVRRLS